ncbi:MAG TPA: 3-oxoacyl-ACP reductase family protein [Terracidiphilus sp.]|jgi:acetoacetyl-CoA reductase|nr:3-oxoacyl-ACP reductase family protein [Terracidiphilus sp.]
MTTIAVHPERGISIERPLEGKIALITGASRGIGRAIALELAHLGASVAINFKARRSAAETLRDEVHQLGCDCEVFQEDVSDRQQARKLITVVQECFHRLDILVNNAGITRDHSIAKMSDEEWLEVINTNLNSVFYCTNAALPAMIEQRYGRIVNIASFVGQAGNFGQANYAASKGGIIAMTKVLALELAKYNITANVIAPGFTETEMVGAIPPEILEQIKARIPLKRLARPEEIAKAAAFLICNGDYITGQQINVNGGIYM